MRGEHGVYSGFQRIEVALIYIPEDLQIDLMIFVPQDVSKRGDFPPRNVGTECGFPLIRNMPRRLAQNFEKSLKRGTADAIIEHLVNRPVGEQLPNVAYGLLDVQQSIGRSYDHQNTMI